MKRFISAILVFVMVLGMVPVGEMVAFAEDPPTAKITSVLVTKTYSKPQDIDVMYIEVTGTDLDVLGKNPVIFKDQTGAPAPLSTIVESKKKLHYKIEKPNGVSSISVDGDDYQIGSDKMPSVLNLTPSNGLVDSGSTITINGSGFKQFRELPAGQGVINFYNKSGSLDNANVGDLASDGDTKLTKSFPSNTPGGPYRVEFKYKDAKLTIVDNYVNLFSVVGELDVSDNITMVPNQGPTGTTVKIKGEELKQTKDMSVFFLTSLDGSDPYTKDNMGIDETYQANAEKAKSTDTVPTIDVFTVKVPPKLKQGVRYYVVLTNDVKQGEDPTGKISSKKTFVDNIFTVVDNKDTLSISDVSPNKGPETGKDVLLQGRYIGTMSTNVFAPDNNSKFVVNDGKKIDTSSSTLKVSYEPKDSSKTIGKYKLIGGENGVNVKKITREITVFIGGKATFREGYSFTDGLDKLEIRTPSVNIPEGEDPSKEVTVEVITKIDYEGQTKPLEVTETGSWKGGKFTFEPISYRPKITSIIPNQIPVDDNNKIAKSFKISIIGENFFKYRYKDDKGVTQVKYPVIDLGGQVILDPNIKEETTTNGIKRIPVKSDDIKVINKAGIEIDGTSGNDLGTKVLITVPEGIPIGSVINQISRLKITNPIKNEENITKEEPDKHMGLFSDGEIKFVKVGSEKTPIITSVIPSTVTTDGEKGVTISGANFGEKALVYLDGEKLTSKRNSLSEITFDAPKKSEGIYQIVVQNEEGGLATFDEFVYVQTETNIKLTDFAPKKGSANTLVSIKGVDFQHQNPLVKDISGAGIYKLIGTRVFLGPVIDDNDVNKYNRENGKITLKDFAPTKAIVSDDGGKLKVEDYHDSVVLLGKDGEGKDKYYRIYKNASTGKIMLTDGDKDVFELSVKNGKVYAKKTGGVDREVELSDPKKVIVKDEGIELRIQTLYQTNKDNTEITGNNVKVLNSGEVIFTVPPKAKQGYYDLTVMNPDNKKDSKVGNSGFWYFFQPQSNPKITTITPNQGSTQGDYFVEIKGEDFKDTGATNKASVIIGGIVVDSKDIQVSTDGKTIRFKVPKYPGDLNKETQTGRKTVPVVVVNPDGASDSKEEGFTYVIPISNPKITALVLNKGTAAGGETVSVEGDDFRFFEPFRDINNNNKWDDAEPYTDTNGNGKYDEGEPFDDINKDGSGKSNGIWDPAESFDDLNNDGKWTDLRGKKIHELNSEDKKILPTIYFGNQVVEILSFNEGSIEVRTPKGVKGAIDVYLVNNDYGVSNKVKYTYEASTPKIKSITPKVGKKLGGNKVEILGESFYESLVKVINSNSTTKDQSLQLVQFGDLKDTNISNRDVKIDAPKNSGRISNREATVEVGNLTVSYDATGSDKRLLFSLEEKQGAQIIKYTLDYTGYDDNEIFLPVSLLEDSSGKSPTLSWEYVRIKLETIPGASVTNKLRVDRGFSPSATLINTGHITLETPSYYTIGKVPVTVINPDGSEAKGEFEYKNPDSEPKIDDIKRNGKSGREEVVEGETNKVIYVNIKGGDNIEVTGKDFRKPVKIMIGDVITIDKDIEYDPNNTPQSVKATFKMPKIDDKYANNVYRLILENEDGGVTSSEQSTPPIYIKFFKGESNPEIISIDPKTGPSKGGTEVIIKGKDFRTTMQGFDGTLKVYFDDGVNIEEAKYEFIDIETIKVTSPPSKTKIKQIDPVEATIKVENPDGSIAISKDKFIYTGPIIEKIIKAEGSTMGDNIVHIEGKQFEFHDLVGKTMDKLTEEEKKLLPEVYFGKNKAEVLSFGEDTMELKVPKGTGQVDVYLKNSNGEQSARVKYGYIATKPVIDSITPKKSPSSGGIKVEIIGSGFYESQLRIYESTKYQEKKKNMVLIQFAEDVKEKGYTNISNKNITDVNDKNIGIFSNNKAKVQLGNLTVDYDGTIVTEGKKKLIVSLNARDVKYSGIFEYDDSKIEDAEIFIPVGLLKDSSGNAYQGNEIVKINKVKLQETNNIYRLVAERGYAESVKLENLTDGKQKISIEKIPSYYDNKSIKIEVTNPDGQTVNTDFEYKKPIISPKITNIVDPLNNNIKKESLSIDGGETIKILGSDFFKKGNSEADKDKSSNLRVVFNPKLEKIDTSKVGESDKDIITILGVDYKLVSGDTLTLEDIKGDESEGNEGENPNLEFVDANTIIINKTPIGKKGTGGIIVINPDGGATQIYDIKYGLSEITYPQEIRASLINNQYIRINWNQVIETGNDNVQYEIYVVEGDSSQFIGSTRTTGFIFRDIKPNTTYKFLVRSIGKYGPSKPINESMSNPVTTGSVAGPVDNDGKPGEKTKVEKTGNTANVVIGEDAFAKGDEYIIDTTRGSLAGSSKVVVSMSSKIVANEKNKNIKIVGKDYILSFSPNVFENSTITSNKDNANSGVKFEVYTINTNFDLKQNNSETILASKYILGARVFVGRSSNEIENLNGNMNFVLDYDSNIVESRRMKTIKLVKYDKYERVFKHIKAKSEYGTSMGDINELGTYTIVGSRR